jgi:MEMO1 family protein
MLFRNVSFFDEGMAALSTLDPAQFQAYLDETKNTICGRNPLMVFLQACAHLKREAGTGRPRALAWLHYSQSSKAASKDDSSVSYAAGSAIL